MRRERLTARSANSLFPGRVTDDFGNAVSPLSACFFAFAFCLILCSLRTINPGGADPAVVSSSPQ